MLLKISETSQVRVFICGSPAISGFDVKQQIYIS